MIEGARYAHTNLVARDWRALAAFYTDLFGCRFVPPERDDAGAVLAVAARAFDMLDHAAPGRQAEDQRKVGAQIVDALAVRPHPDRATGPLRDRARRRHRSMRDVGAGGVPPHRALRLCGFCVRVALIDRRRLHRLALDPGAQVRLIRQRLAAVPGRAGSQLAERRRGCCLGLRDDTGETAIPHDRHPSCHALGRCRVQ